MIFNLFVKMELLYEIEKMNIQTPEGLFVDNETFWFEQLKKVKEYFSLDLEKKTLMKYIGATMVIFSLLFFFAERFFDYKMSFFNYFQKP